MDFKWIAILVLAVLSYWQFVAPASANEKLEPLWGTVQSFIDNKNPLNDNEGTCPTAIDKVCGSNNITYNNECLANKAGVDYVVAGACV